MTLKEELKLDNAVDDFANRMKIKLFKKVKEGRSGWDNPHNSQRTRNELWDHVARLCDGDEKQAVDVAALAMMLLYQKEAQNENPV